MFNIRSSCNLQNLKRRFQENLYGNESWRKILSFVCVVCIISFADNAIRNFTFWNISDGRKILSVLLLVIPAVIGIVVGVLGINRKEVSRWMAVLGILLNAFFALSQIFVISFAG